jgi:hypothetical protein
MHLCENIDHIFASSLRQPVPILQPLKLATLHLILSVATRTQVALLKANITQPLLQLRNLGLVF